MGYDAIRNALGRGFSVDTLNEITRVGHEMVDADTSISHPAAAYALAATAQKIAWYWEGYPIENDIAEAIESTVRPKMEAVLAAAEGDNAALLAALDGLARAYSDARPFLRSIGT